MLTSNPALLEKALRQLERATLDHAVWRDHLLRVISGRLPGDPNDLARMRTVAACLANGTSSGRCRAAGPAVIRHDRRRAREPAPDRRPTAAHVSAGARVGRAEVEEFEEASARLSFALYFVRREIECSLHSRDTLTAAHSSGFMLQDLREWHALARQPGRQCCIA